MSIRGRIFCSKTVFLMLAGLCVVCMARNAAAAGGAIKASGMLMSVEKDRSVIIDKQGYLTVASTKIIDTKGKHISFRQISLPARVDFKYVYSAKGPVIKVIQMRPKIIPR